jgi:hypothetical protein
MARLNRLVAGEDLPFTIVIRVRGRAGIGVVGGGDFGSFTLLLSKFSRGWIEQGWGMASGGSFFMRVDRRRMALGSLLPLNPFPRSDEDSV